MKRIMICLVLAVMCVAMIACGKKENVVATTKEITTEESTTKEITTEESTTKEITTEESTTEELSTEELTETKQDEVTTQEMTIETETESEVVKENTNKMNIQIGEITLTATLEDNVSVEALKKLMGNGGLTINYSGYGGFEQVGSIGQSLPRNDQQMTTSAGDIVLYAGNQIVMFYGSNSWSYTKLAKINDVSGSELKSILGSGDITATFSLAE